MSDEVDLKELEAGNVDLVRRDFRRAKLSGLDLRGRDFSASHLESADLSYSDLSNCILNGINALGLNLNSAKLNNSSARNTVFHGVNLSYVDARGANLSGSHFMKVNFSDSDLRGANFAGAHFNDGCLFDRCITDATTHFDEATILRALSRHDCFRYYSVERGKLKRKNSEEIADSSDSLDTSVNERRIIVRNSRELISIIDRTHCIDSDLFEKRGIGHNNPPSDTPLNEADCGNLKSVLNAISSDLDIVETPINKLNEIAATIFGYAKKITLWLARKCDTAADEFSKQLGKAGALALVGLGLWPKVSELLGEIGAAIQSLVRLAGQ